MNFVFIIDVNDLRLVLVVNVLYIHIRCKESNVNIRYKWIFHLPDLNTLEITKQLILNTKVSAIQYSRDDFFTVLYFLSRKSHSKKVIPYSRIFIAVLLYFLFYFEGSFYFLNSKYSIFDNNLCIYCIFQALFRVHPPMILQNYSIIDNFFL